MISQYKATKPAKKKPVEPVLDNKSEKQKNAVIDSLSAKLNKGAELIKSQDQEIHRLKKEVRDLKKYSNGLADKINRYNGY